MRIDRFAHLLRCPRTHEPLHSNEKHMFSASGETYPIVNGIPVLVKNVEPLHTTPPASQVLSKNASEFHPPQDLSDKAVVLHLGCGDVPSTDPRVISLDILPTSSVDVVAEAETLPFKTGSIDYIVSGAVFEHVYDPAASIAEVRRVLKPGGIFKIDTAFMQSYHGFPSHFFNMTPQAAETLLIDDFELVQSGVPASGSITHTLIGLLNRLTKTLPAAESERFADMKVGDLLKALQEHRGKTNPLFASLSEYSHRAMAASFVVMGKKPEDYETRRLKAKDEIGADVWARMKRAYYAARLETIFRYHEVDLYRDRCLAQGKDIPSLPRLSPLQGYLDRGKVADPMAPQEWIAATQRLGTYAAGFVNHRNRWIQLFQAAPPAA